MKSHHKIFHIKNGLMHYAEATISDELEETPAHFDKEASSWAQLGLEKAIADFNYTGPKLVVSDIAFTYVDTTLEDMSEAAYKAAEKIIVRYPSGKGLLC